MSAEGLARCGPGSWRTARALLAIGLACLAMVAPPSAEEDAKAWVTARGWRPGPCAKGQFLAIGTAPLHASADDPSAVREAAFEMACLDAKNRLAEFLASEVSVESVRSLTKDDDPLGKIARRMEPMAEDRAILEERFHQACWLAARAEIGGLTTARSFLSADQVAVVMRCDSVSIAMVEAAAAGRALPAPAELPPLSELATASPETLASFHGVRLMRDDSGLACLVAFGQAGVRDEPLARDRAMQRARQRATGVMRRFLFESVDAQAVRQTFCKEMVLADGGSRFRVAADYRRVIEGSSEAVSLPALRDVRTWLDASGRVVGCAELLPVAGLAVRPPLQDGGNSAEVRIVGGRVHATASAVGRFVPRPGEGAHAPIMRRAVAVRAAVIAAKAEIARRFGQLVSAGELETSSTADGLHYSSEIRTRVIRECLTGAVLDGVEDLVRGDEPAVRVRISVNASAAASPTGGLPTFASEREGAAALAGLALQGLCGTGPIRGLVGTADRLRMVVFVVGLGSDSTAARHNAVAEALQFARGIVSGEMGLSVAMDALSANGSAAAVQETYFSSWMVGAPEQVNVDWLEYARPVQDWDAQLTAWVSWVRSRN